jgi:predicted NBD/HSP70 family sugar kinase
VETGSLAQPVDRPRGARPGRRAVAATSPLTSEHIRRANAWSVLQAVRAAGVSSRTAITAATGLTGMSVHRLIAELRRRRLVVPAGRTAVGAVGRPSSLFRFNASIAHVVGIDVGNETTRAELTDLDGTVRARRETPTAAVEDDLAAHLLDLVAELREGSGVELDGLVGVAIGVPAVAGPDGTILRASQHHQWEGLDLGGCLRAALGIEVVVRQDDHLAALAELRGGACAGARSAVVLDVGKGIGVGVITGGQVHGGIHNAAGRVAWIPIPVDEGREPGGIPIGQLLTADGLIADYRRLGGTAPADGALPVFEADADGDPAASEAIDLFAARLGWLVAAIVAVMDPEVVVIGGGISRSYARLAEGVTGRLGSIIATPPPIVASTLGPQAVVNGAIDAALGLADAWLQEQLGS